eukprot:tig00020675_g12676.t1
MPVCHVYVMNRNGGVLVSRYFDELAPAEQSAWEQRLRAVLADGAAGLADEEERVACIGDRIVCFGSFGDLVACFSGEGETDELILSDALRAYVSVIKAISKKKTQLSEAMLLENYPKAALALDEIVNQGLIEVLDATRIRNNIKLKLDE